MPTYYVFYEELTPGPRTLYFSGPIHSAGHGRRGTPKVGDEIEFRYLDAQAAEDRRPDLNAHLRAQIKGIEPVDNRSFRFAAQPLVEESVQA